MGIRSWVVGGLFATAALAVAAAGQDRPATRHVHGWVSDTDGRPVPGVVVAIGTPSGPPASSSPRAVTDQDGFYRLDEVPAGEHRLFVAPERVRSSPVVRFASPAVTRCDVRVARPARVRVRLQGADGAPIGGARVVGHWRDLRGSPHRLDTTFDEQGRLLVETLGGMFDARFRVELAGDAGRHEFTIADFARTVRGAERWTVGQGVEPPAGVSAEPIDAPTGSVPVDDGDVPTGLSEVHEVQEGRVIDRRTKAPVAGAWIVERGLPSHPGLPGPELCAELGLVVRAVTDDDGVFRLRTPEDAPRLRYVAYAPGYCSASYGKVFDPAEPWVIGLRRSHSVTGVVRDERGQPVPGAVVYPQGARTTLAVTTDESGGFEFPTLPDYAVSLRVRPPPRRWREFGYGDRGPYASDAKDVPIRLPARHEIRIAVRSPEGAPLRGARGELLDADGSALDRFPVGRADKNGVLVFGPVDLGSYQLVVTAPGYETRQRFPVTTEPGQAIVLLPLVPVRQRVVTPDGTPVAHTRWHLARLEGGGGLPRGSSLARNAGPIREVISDADGSWEVRLPRATHWQVIPAYDTRSRIDPRGPGPGFFLDVPNFGSHDVTTIVGGFRLLTGVLRDASGEPVSGAGISVDPLDSELRFSARTEPDGRFGFLIPTDKRCRVRWMPDTARPTSSFRTAEPFQILGPGSGRIDMELRLHGLARLSGRLRTADGRPVADVRLRFDVLGRPKERVLVWTDDDGRFWAESFPLGISTAWLAERRTEEGESVRIGTVDFRGAEVELTLPE